MAVLALPLSVAAVALSLFAWLTGRGRSSAQVLDRASELERAVMTGVQALGGRVEAAESIIRGLAEEAHEQFARAEKARKRGQQDAARAEALTGGDGAPAPGEEMPTDRAGQLRVVAERLARIGNLA